jgi:hypothetical protein
MAFFISPPSDPNPWSGNPQVYINKPDELNMKSPRSQMCRGDFDPILYFEMIPP